MEHAQGGDESARLSGADAYNHFFAPPLWLSLFDEYSDDVSRARLYYNDFAELTRACSLSAMDFVSQAGGRCMEQFAAFVAIDWSDAKHDICLLDVATGKKEAGTPQKSLRPGPPHCAPALPDNQLLSVWSSRVVL